MKLKTMILSALFAGSVALHTVADDRVITVIDGSVTERTLSKITFDGDLAVIVFSDDTSETVDMSLVSILFAGEGESLLDCVVSDPSIPSGVYNMRGQRVSEDTSGLIPGIYVINGEKIFVR